MIVTPHDSFIVHDRICFWHVIHLYSRDFDEPFISMWDFWHESHLIFGTWFIYFHMWFFDTWFISIHVIFDTWFIYFHVWFLTHDSFLFRWFFTWFISINVWFLTRDLFHSTFDCWHLIRSFPHVIFIPHDEYFCTYDFPCASVIMTHTIRLSWYDFFLHDSFFHIFEAYDSLNSTCFIYFHISIDLFIFTYYFYLCLFIYWELWFFFPSVSFIFIHMIHSVWQCSCDHNMMCQVQVSSIFQCRC